MDKMGETTQKVVTEKANSFCGRYGKAGSEIKIYFDTKEQLIEGINTVFDGVAHFNKRLSELKAMENEDGI